YGALVHNPDPPHFQTLDNFMSQASSGNLPSVSFVDFTLQESEHPPFDIGAGQAMVASVINAVRSGPNWKDSVIILTYDEHGGFYDHVTPIRSSAEQHSTRKMRRRVQSDARPRRALFRYCQRRST